MLRLKLLRLELGESQWALSRVCAMSQGRYSMLERGLLAPTPAERSALAKALGVPAGTLFRSVVSPARRGAPPALAEAGGRTEG